MNPPPARTRIACVHCGTPFDVHHEGEKFCCSGCEFVFGLIHQENLDRYYEFKDPTAPAGGQPFHTPELAWMTPIVDQTESKPDPICRTTLEIQGVSCAACVWLVEKVFARHPGAVEARVHPSAGRIHLAWQRGACDLAAFARHLQQFGYRLGPPRADGSASPQGPGIRLGLCAAFAMNAMLFTLPHYLGIDPAEPIVPVLDAVALVLATLSLAVGGSVFARRSWHGLRSGIIHIDLPITLGLAAAYVASVFAWTTGRREWVYLDFVSVFTFLMLVGRWIQERAVAANRQRILSTRFQPGPVHRIQPEGETPIDPASLRPGWRYRTQPGHHIPVRSRLLSPETSFALDWINGESEPLATRTGAIVPSGAQHVGATSIELEALETWDQALLPALLNAECTEPPRDTAMENFIRNYLITVLVLAAGGWAGWMLAGQTDLAWRALVSVLVVSCPCASGVSVPLTYEYATSAARRLGFFVRRSDFWPRARRIRRILFDKTGTLTLDTPELSTEAPLDRLTREEQSVLLAMAESSLHPVSRSLRQVLLRRGIPPLGRILVFREICGQGLEAEDGERIWRLGRASSSTPPHTGTLFSCQGEVLASFHFTEKIRRGAIGECASLQQAGYTLGILSGDSLSKVGPIAAGLGIPSDQVHTDLDPAQKLEWVHALDHQDTLMLGDGANDSLAFEAAWCRGTPAIDRGMLEQRADFYIMGTHLSGLSALLKLAHTRQHAARATVAFSILYNAVMIVLALTGHIGPLVAAVVMPLSSLVSLAIVTAFFAPSRGT